MCECHLPVALVLSCSTALSATSRVQVPQWLKNPLILYCSHWKWGRLNANEPKYTASAAGSEQSLAIHMQQTDDSVTECAHARQLR